MGGINESFKKVGKRLFLFDENIKINEEYYDYKYLLSNW